MVELGSALENCVTSGEKMLKALPLTLSPVSWLVASGLNDQEAKGVTGVAATAVGVPIGTGVNWTAMVWGEPLPAASIVSVEMPAFAVWVGVGLRPMGAAAETLNTPQLDTIVACIRRLFKTR